MTYIKGFDVSMYEDKVNWQNVAQSEFKNFVFIRSGQGTIKDKRHNEHWSGAKDVGIPRGSYWVYDPRYKTGEPQRQAENWVVALGNDLGELPLMADIEKYTSGAWHGYKYWRDFLEYVKALLPSSWKNKWISLGLEPVGIYTGFYYFRDQSGLGMFNQIMKDYFGKHPLWLADYGANDADLTKPPESRKRIPLLSWKKWMFWQYGEHLIFRDMVTNENGSPTNVDTNVFNGSEDDFKAMFGIGDTSPLPSGDPYQAGYKAAWGEIKKIAEEKA